ncbi:MAG: TetR family transcriptional regulator [Bacteroides graminisolvens]|nr:TetR family transcriptional regulator [Bacteroides graminisolvens]
MNSKDRILQAAEDMFYQKGYPLTTIRDIAAKAKMNSAVINYHFGSKENLYLTILKKMEKALNSVCIKRDISENDLFVKNFIKKFFHGSMPATQGFSSLFERAIPILYRSFGKVGQEVSG